MKYSMAPLQVIGNPTAMFCEQVSTITALFEHWNDCERTVVLYALLKRIPSPNLKFLQLCIDSNLQNIISHSELNSLEQNANNPLFLKNIVKVCRSMNVHRLDNELNDRIRSQSDEEHVNNSYNPFSCFKRSSIQNDICYDNSNFTKSNSAIDGSRYIHDYSSPKPEYDDIDLENFKDIVLPELLRHLPLLHIGNDEAKSVYLSVVPQAVGRVGCEDLCQQLLSYLLIHPAVNSEDRRYLTLWLRHLEDHISGSTSPINPCQPARNLENHPQRHTWHVPNHHNGSGDLNHSQTSLGSVLNNQRVTSGSWNSYEYIAPPKDEFRKTIGKNMEFKTVLRSDSAFDEDSHESFSKNGTEIDDGLLETKPDTNEHYNSNLRTESCSNDFFTQTNKLYSVSSKENDMVLKSRRSNSLTPSTTNENMFKSNENINLSNLMNKPRSFSLSNEHSALLSPRSSLASNKSEKQLNECKLQAKSLRNGGMANIAYWLKSLRLHKYAWLFSTLTYEQMMGINEDYLQTLGVTKGARHKLVLCIQKLRDRFNTLCQVEQDLISSQGAAVFGALEELRAVIVSPIKPGSIQDGNIVGQFVKVLEMVANLIRNNHKRSVQDEECVSLLYWVVERAMHNEAFSHMAHKLKELQGNTHDMSGGPTYNPNVATFQNGPGNGYGMVYNPNRDLVQRRNSDANGRNKVRWSQYVNPRMNNQNQQQWPSNQVAQHANYQHNSFDNRIPNPTNPFNQTQVKKYKMPQQLNLNDGKCNKSSSFPNFCTKPNARPEQHRHSLTSLVPQTNKSGMQDVTGKCKRKTSVVEINTRLESLCLQMTEQAIE